MGQELELIADVVTAGARVVTSAQALNQAGSTIMTFAAARDYVYLRAVQVGGALRWNVVSNDGVALT